MKITIDRWSGVVHGLGMDKETFIATAVSIYGNSGWQTQLADALGISEQSVHRYKKGTRPVPQPVALAMEGLKARKEAGK